MAEKMTIRVTEPEHLIALGMALGYMTAVEALEKVTLGDKLPGFGLALAKLQALEARHRAHTAGRNIRMCVKHGVDIELYDIAWMGNGEIICQPIDVASPSAEAKP